MILEAMYNGEFYPCETVVPTSPEYRKAIIACEKAHGAAVPAVEQRGL